MSYQDEIETQAVEHAISLGAHIVIESGGRCYGIFFNDAQYRMRFIGDPRDLQHAKEILARTKRVKLMVLGKSAWCVAPEPEAE